MADDTKFMRAYEGPFGHRPPDYLSLSFALLNKFQTRGMATRKDVEDFYGQRHRITSAQKFWAEDAMEEYAKAMKILGRVLRGKRVSSVQRIVSEMPEVLRPMERPDYIKSLRTFCGHEPSDSRVLGEESELDSFLYGPGEFNTRKGNVYSYPKPQMRNLRGKLYVHYLEDMRFHRSKPTILRREIMREFRKLSEDDKKLIRERNNNFNDNWSEMFMRLKSDDLEYEQKLEQIQRLQGIEAERGIDWSWYMHDGGRI